jgi:hypothetical protein
MRSAGDNFLDHLGTDSALEALKSSIKEQKNILIGQIKEK